MLHRAAGSKTTARGRGELVRGPVIVASPVGRGDARINARVDAATYREQKADKQKPLRSFLHIAVIVAGMPAQKLLTRGHGD